MERAVGCATMVGMIILIKKHKWPLLAYDMSKR